jgi:hypothetical protein
MYYKRNTHKNKHLFVRNVHRWRLLHIKEWYKTMQNYPDEIKEKARILRKKGWSLG